MTDDTGSIDWNSRILAAGRLYNSETETGAEFAEQLKQRMGISREMGCASAIAALEDDDIFKFGDFREAFKDLPIAVLRMMFKALRGSKGTTEKEVVQHTGGPADPRIEQLKALGYKTKISDAPTPLLLSLYNPALPNDPVTGALKARFGTEPVIAFSDDGTVNVEATIEYASGREQGFPAADTVNIGGRLVKLVPVGVKPDVMVDEDPLCSGSPLRNGVSVVNHRNWSKVATAERQFCRLVVEHGDVDVDNHEAVLRLLERAQSKTLAEAYPEVDLLFREKQKRDELPKLRIPMGQTARPQNPFGVKRQY